jgi:phage FluMu protein Com
MKLKMIFNFIIMNSFNSATPSGTAQESRCRCGNLLARLRPEGVELKCRRCKRVIVIPWGTSSTWHGVTVQWQGLHKERTD